MATETKSFSGVDRERVRKLRDAVAAFVPLPEGDSGSLESHGIKGSFTYNEPAQTLTLSIDESPPFVPRGIIWGTIERALTE